MLRWPGIPILLLRKDLKDLKATVIPEIVAKWPRQLYEPAFGGQWNKSENWIRFPNGSILRYGEAKDWESYKSQTNGKVYIEEANEVEEELFLNIDPTLRWIPSWSQKQCEAPECAELDEEFRRPHPEHPFYQIKLASNPSPGWLKTRFWEPWREGRELKDHAFIPATAYDNPSLPPDFIPKLMENHTATWVQNYIHGDWSSFENMVWPRFSRAIHCWRGAIPFGEFVRVEGGIDYGGTTQEAHRTCAYLTAYLRDGRYLTFWEYSKQGAASTDLFVELAAKTRQFRVQRWWADASQHRANQLLRQNGVPVVDAERYKGAVKDGINHVDRLLTERPTPGARTATGPQLLVVEDACPRLVSGIETYKLNPETGEPEKNQEDDEVNAWRYNIMGITLEEGVKAGVSAGYFVKTKGGFVQEKKPSSMLARVREERRARFKELIEMGEHRTSRY
jgi:phage terminase large subunit